MGKTGGGYWYGLAMCCGLFVLVVALSGCCAPHSQPGACRPAGCGPTVMCPAVVPQYAEPQWSYYDRAGVPRVMGDTRLRAHLGLLPGAGAVAE